MKLFSTLVTLSLDRETLCKKFHDRYVMIPNLVPEVKFLPETSRFFTPNLKCKRRSSFPSGRAATRGDNQRVR